MRPALTTFGAAILLVLTMTWPSAAQTTAPIEVDHTADVEAVASGGEVTFTVTLTNPGSTEVVVSSVEVELDELLSAVDGTVLANNLPVPADEGVTLSYTVIVGDDLNDRTEPVESTVIVEGPQGTTRTTVSRPLTRVADGITASVARTPSSQLVRPGETVEYLLEVTNDANNVDATDVTVLVNLDQSLFDLNGKTVGGLTVEDGKLVWPVGPLTAGATKSKRFTVTAVDQFSVGQEPGPLELTVDADGSRNVTSSDVVRLAGSAADLVVEHTPELGEQAVVGPGDQIDYLVTVTNTSARPIEDLVVTVARDAEVFSSIEALDLVDQPTEGEEQDEDDAGRSDDNAAQGVLIGERDLLEANSKVLFRYRAGVVARFVARSQAVNVAFADVGGSPTQEPSRPVDIASAIETVVVTHTVAGSDTIEPGDTVVFSITVANPNSFASINNIAMEVNLNRDLFVSARLVGESEEDATEARWADIELLPKRDREFFYEATARSTFPDDFEGGANTVELTVGVDSIEPVPSTAVKPVESGSSDGSGENTASLSGGLLFALIVVFLLIAFVSISSLVIGRRTGLDERQLDVGLNLFATLSLVSATLIIAFGTRVGEEALALLAAIAGYVLGRSSDSGFRRPPGPAVTQHGPDGAPSPVDQAAGTATAESGAAVAAPVISGPAVGPLGPDGAPAPVAVAGPVVTGTHEWRRARDSKRYGLMALLMVAVLSPVLIVLSTIWLLDSTDSGTPVPIGTYLSGGTLALLVLVFVCFIFYLYSEATGLDALAALRTRRPQEEQPVGEQRDDPAAATGPDDTAEEQDEDDADR